MANTTDEQRYYCHKRTGRDIATPRLKHKEFALVEIYGGREVELMRVTRDNYGLLVHKKRTLPNQKYLKIRGV